MRVPVNQPYTTNQSIPFGRPDNAARFKFHAGVDYAVAVGTNVFAPISGVVTGYIWGQYHGNVVEIKAADGKHYHMLHNSRLLVSPGQSVNEGQLVSYSGATGQGVTGPHVHFGVASKSLPNVTSFADFYDPNELLKQQAPKGDIMQTDDDVRLAFTAVEHKTASPDDIRAWKGLPYNRYIGEVLRGNNWLTQNHLLAVAYPQAQRDVQRLTNELQDVYNQLNTLQKQAEVSKDFNKVLTDGAAKVSSLTAELDIMKATNAQLEKENKVLKALTDTPVTQPAKESTGLSQIFNNLFRKK